MAVKCSIGEISCFLLRAFYSVNTGRNRAKQHSGSVDWSLLKGRLLSGFILTIFIRSTLQHMRQ